MTELFVKIMVEVLSVLALATKNIKQGRLSKRIVPCRLNVLNQCFAEAFAKKQLGESEIENVLRRLDRLTQEEARVTLVHTMQVVHGLMNTVKVVMNGTQAYLCHISAILPTFSILLVDGKASTENIRQALGTFGLTQSVLSPAD